MAKISGMNGAVTVDSTTLCVKSWRLTENVDMVDVTDTCSDGWREQIPTFKKAEGSFEAFYDEDSPPTLTLGQLVTLDLITDLKNGGYGYTGSAYVTQIEVSLDVAGAVTYNGQFQFTGAVSRYGISGLT